LPWAPSPFSFLHRGPSALSLICFARPEASDARREALPFDKNDSMPRALKESESF
jgi:hypothetical protein